MEKIDSLLMFLGFGKSYRGYRPFASCIGLALENEERLGAVTKEIYIPVAVEYHTTFRCIERNIRTLCQNAWKCGGKERLEVVFERTWDKVPTNLEFMELIMELYRRRAVPATHMF